MSWHHHEYLVAALFDPKTLDMRHWTKAAFLAVMHHLLRDENSSVNGFIYFLDGTGVELKHKLYWGLDDIKRHMHIVQVNINTLRPNKNGRHFADDFQMHFSEWKCWHFDWNIGEVRSHVSSWKWGCIGLGNGLAPNNVHQNLWCHITSKRDMNDNLKRKWIDLF